MTGWERALVVAREFSLTRGVSVVVSFQPGAVPAGT